MEFGAAVLLVDGSGIIVANKRAAEVLARGPLRCDRQRACLSGPLAKEIHSFAARLAAETAADGEGNRVLFGEHEGLALIVALCRLEPLPSRDAGKPVTLVIAARADRRVTPQPEDLAAAYGLTPAESELLAALASGVSLTAYCERAGISLNTGKSHLRQIFAKTYTNRQSELVREVLANPLIQFRQVFH